MKPTAQDRADYAALQRALMLRFARCPNKIRLQNYCELADEGNGQGVLLTPFGFRAVRIIRQDDGGGGFRFMPGMVMAI
jgi:hypothetical protein